MEIVEEAYQKCSNANPANHAFACGTLFTLIRTMNLMVKEQRTWQT